MLRILKLEYPFHKDVWMQSTFCNHYKLYFLRVKVDGMKFSIGTPYSGSNPSPSHPIPDTIIRLTPHPIPIHIPLTDYIPFFWFMEGIALRKFCFSLRSQNISHITHTLQNAIHLITFHTTCFQKSNIFCINIHNTLKLKSTSLSCL